MEKIRKIGWVGIGCMCNCVLAKVQRVIDAEGRERERERGRGRERELIWGEEMEISLDGRIS